jgi:hypothetical protein
VLLLTGIVASGAFAAPLAYTINFTTDVGSSTPTSGSFTHHNAEPPGSQFTAFDVEWDGLIFDLTSDANTGGQSIGCGATTSTTIFAILSGTGECSGADTIRWVGGHTSLDNTFHFRDSDGSGNIIQIVAVNPSTGTGGASGTFSITRQGSQTPERFSFILALPGVALLVLNRRRPSTRICL